MKTPVTIISLSAIPTCLTLSAQETPRAAGGGLAERLKQLDRNGDGKVIRTVTPQPWRQVTSCRVNAYYGS
jgi:hypothetical protein